MVRALLGFLALLIFAGAAHATCPVIPFIFSNGTRMDATHVDQNFAAIRDCANASTGDVLGPGASAIGNVVTFSDTAGHRIADSGAPPTLIVPTNAALKAKSTVGIKALLRNGFLAQGDVAPLMYVASSSPCTLNAGLGDDGSQVKSADSRCWIAAFANGVVDPRQFGCAGDGVTDDTVCFQAAIDAAAYKTVQLVSGHYYCITAATITSAMTLAGANLGVVPPAGSGGIIACAKNANLISVNAGGVIIRGVVLNGTGGNTGGYAFGFNANDIRLENSLINGFCNYIINGGSHNVVNGNTFTDNVNPTDSTGCYVITDGTASVQAVGSVYTNNLMTTWGPAAAQTYTAGFLFQNSGGPYVSKNDVQRTNFGTIIKPIAGKAVAFAFFDQTVLGDTTNSDGLLIDTNAGSIVQIIKINNSYISRNGDWAGTAGWASDARNATIQNTGGGGANVSGIHINGLSAVTASDENITVVDGTSDVTIDNSVLCYAGQKTPKANLVLLGSTGGVRNNTIAAACDSPDPAFTSQATYNIEFVNPTSSNWVITGNFLGGGSTDYMGGELNNDVDMTVANNHPLDNDLYVVASAAVIDFVYHPFVEVTGSVAVTNMRFPWKGRAVRIYILDGLTFTAGGGGTDPICVNAIVPAGGLVQADFIPGANCWTIH